MTVRELLRPDGRTGRSTYFLTVASAALILHNLLRISIPSAVIDRGAGLGFFYLITIIRGPQSMPADLRRALPLFALVAVPFLWVLVTVTLKRLRDLETTEWYVLLFLIPAVNVLFFLLLCLQPGCETVRAAERTHNTFFENVLPASTWGSAAAGALAGASTATILSWFAVVIVGGYGSTLFLALPFFMGYIAAWLHGYNQPRIPTESYVVALASLFLAAALIVGIAFEGIICVAMAIPLAVPLALLGGHLAHLSQTSRSLQPQPTTMLGLMLVLPLLAGAEFLGPSRVPQHVVHSSVEIDAPPSIIWPRILSFPRIDEKPNWILRLGMAYPIAAETSGSGLTADRRTTFSTGISHELLLAWEEDKHLAFRVGGEPPLMKESSPYGTIHVRHLEDHDFRPGRVDFLLTELPGGRTKLDCWSSYENLMWPAPYWQLWTDEIVRQIQLRVFRHVKRLAEAEMAARVSSELAAKEQWRSPVR